MSSVNDLSEEEFEANYDKMMTMTPEEFDASHSESEEETLAESPADEENSLQTEDDNTEQPLETEDDEQEPASTAEEELGSEAEEATEVEEDSQTETNEDEFSFDAVPRDKIIPKDIAVNGMTVRATMDELEEGFKKGMNYTQKMQEIAPHRKNMNLMNEHGLSTDDLNLLIEAKGGNKEALGKLLANAKVDPLDVEPEESKDYTPQNYAKEVSHIEMEQIKNTILQDQDNAPIVENALQTMPEDMYELVSSDTKGMNSLYNDVKTGLYSKVMPEVIKQQSLYGMQEPTLDTYLRVAGQLHQEPTTQEKVVPKENKEELNNKRRSAAPNRGTVNKKKESFIAEDLDALDDDKFEEEFQKMVGRSVNDFK